MDKQLIPYYNNIIDYCKCLIDRTLYKALFYLFKYLFLNDKKTISSKKAKKKLDSIIITINKKIIKKEEYYINLEYSKKNFLNIFRFIKSQNSIYASDIIENIMIIIFSLSFKANKEDTFPKYIYNNLKNIKNPESTELAEWFDSTNFKPEELKNFKTLLIEGPFLDNNLINVKMTEAQKKNIFYNILMIIYFEKRDYYENKFKKITNVKKKKENKKTIFTTNELLNIQDVIPYTSINNYEYHEGDLNKTENTSINITRSFFISVYIYYQNKNSPLMKYIEKNEEKEELAIIPFVYDLSGAVIREKFAEIVMAPARIEPRIHCLDMSKNILEKRGLVELYKILIFNKSIKNVDFHRLAIKSQNFDFLNKKFDIFCNYEVEELNLSNNYIKEDCEEFLCNILYTFKGIKTINLSMNNLKSGISSFLIILKKLYRQNKTKLESLYLIDCMLDDTSFYELGQLLTCKYCKLKNLYLNKNKIPLNSNFLKKLKKNKSLAELYFNNSNIRDEQADDIKRIISNSNIECLSLYKNNFSNFNDGLRIVYRTKLVMNKKERNKGKIIKADSLLFNLDLSDNDYQIKNTNHIFLLDKIIEQTTLYCLDLVHILFEYNIKKNIEEKIKSNYQKEVIHLKDKLDKENQKYVEIMRMINANEIKAKKLKKYENNIYNNIIMNKIDEIIRDKNAIFPIFLREKSKMLINEFIENTNEINKKETEENLVKLMEFELAMKKLNELKEKRKSKKIFLL